MLAATSPPAAGWDRGPRGPRRHGLSCAKRIPSHGACSAPEPSLRLCEGGWVGWISWKEARPTLPTDETTCGSPL